MLHLLTLALVLAPLAFAQSHSIFSPGGRLQATLQLRDGQLSWQATYRGKPIVLESRLGLSLYSGVWTFTGRSAATHAGVWRPVYGERSLIPDNYNELTLDLKDRAAPFRPLQIVIRAYDEGLALRYVIQGRGPVLFPNEYTSFRLPPGAHVWEEHGTEGEYAKVPVEKLTPGCERPLTVEYPHGLYASIGEAANTDYPRMLLSPVRDGPGEIISDLAGPVSADAPYSTPWRFVVVGERPGELMERNYLVLNLNPPSALRDASWIRPGKIIREVTLSTKGGKAAVDFAVARNLQYIEYDAGWYGYEYDDLSDATRVSLDPRRVSSIPDHGGLDLPEVIRHARSKGVGVFLYVNRRALERQLDQLLPLYQSWGVKGLKFGFVNVGPREWTAWLHDAIRKAAAHRLMIDIHDSYRPSGFTRTYPNLLTQEGVRGNEHMPTADHNATLPFTRFVAGPADYTVCYYTGRLKTTRAHQLALPVVFYSPLQFIYWYDKLLPHSPHRQPPTRRRSCRLPHPRP